MADRCRDNVRSPCDCWRDRRLERIHGQRTSRFFPPSKRLEASPQYSDRTYFGGPDGEVQLDASGGDRPEEVCRGAASHKLQPFGSHPQIKPIKVEGHKGCIVWGSDDQGAPYYAELVVPFSQLVEIRGDRYSLLTLYADKKHILDIIKTLKFLPH